MSIKNLTKILLSLEQQHHDSLQSFIQDEALIIGSITQTNGRCGKPNCECANKPSHPITLLMTTENGKKRSQLIRKLDIERVLILWKTYKKLMALLKSLKNLHKEEIILLKKIIRERSVNYQ